MIRLPRHGASVPIGIGVSCAADRQALAKITAEGVFLEQLETNPARYMPEVEPDQLGGETVEIDLNRPMDEIRATLSQYPIRTLVKVSGPMIVARDARPCPIGVPTSRPARACRNISRTTVSTTPARPRRRRATPPAPSGRPRPGAWTPMSTNSSAKARLGDAGQRQSLARSDQGLSGPWRLLFGLDRGPGARLAQDCIKQVDCIAYPELGMEAIWKIEVEDFPAFIVVGRQRQ